MSIDTFGQAWSFGWRIVEFFATLAIIALPAVLVIGSIVVIFAILGALFSE